MSNSYDMTTALGQTRFHAADTDESQPVFTDGELNYCLQLTGNIPELAAARALRAAAADNAKIAVMTKTGNIGNDESKVYMALLAMADALEKAAPVVMQVACPSAIFTFSPDGGATPGSMDVW